MPSPFENFINSLRDSTQRLDAPQYAEERRLDDLNPRNLYNIDREMTRVGPDQRDILAQERRRLEQAQTQQIMRAAQSFQPRMEQMLQLPKIPTMAGPGAYADIIMKMMGRRQQPPGIPGVNGAMLPRDGRRPALMYPNNGMGVVRG